MKIKIKKLHSNAIIPTYTKDGDAAMDLTATSINRQGKFIEYKTGIAIEIPKGFFGLIRPRSSISNKDLIFNTSGIIDSGYRGELTVRFKIKKQFELLSEPFDIYEAGDRIAQLLILPYPSIDFEEVNELSSSDRGEGGYGSTGK